MFRPLSVLGNRIGQWILWSFEPNTLTEYFLKEKDRSQFQPVPIKKTTYIPPAYKPPNPQKN